LLRGGFTMIPFLVATGLFTATLTSALLIAFAFQTCFAVTTRLLRHLR
jgi:hypothetical protein